jgi:hypothetical protein
MALGLGANQNGRSRYSGVGHVNVGQFNSGVLYRDREAAGLPQQKGIMTYTYSNIFGGGVQALNNADDTSSLNFITENSTGNTLADKRFHHMEPYRFSWPMGMYSPMNTFMIYITEWTWHQSIMPQYVVARYLDAWDVGDTLVSPGSYGVSGKEVTLTKTTAPAPSHPNVNRRLRLTLP